MATASPPPRPSRPFDVVMWGATGFTGKIVAERMLLTYGAGRSLRWALGGRSREKLEKVRADLRAVDPAAGELPILLGDSRDRASLDALAASARVVASTVGPFAVHGRELVAACVDAATDYCDLTGEAHFVRDMIDAHHARAQATGARIVHACGYDSIPSDLGTLMVQGHMREKHGARCAEVKCFASLKGGFSGGTVASMLNMVEEASRDRGVRRVLANPYSLDPDRTERGPDARDQLGVRWDADAGRWTGPFVMAPFNARVVRRTNALLDYAYGRDFRYSEAMGFGAGPGGLLTAAAVTGAIAGAFAVATVAPLRRLLEKTLLPAPGEGPSKEERDAGFFASRFVGTARPEGGAAPVRVLGTVKGASDPGYGETAKMLSESAVCLALDGDAISRRGGVLTPAACMGMRLVERLRAAGMTFETSEAS